MTITDRELDLDELGLAFTPETEAEEPDSPEDLREIDEYISTSFVASLFPDTKANKKAMRRAVKSMSKNVSALLELQQAAEVQADTNIKEQRQKNKDKLEDDFKRIDYTADRAMRDKIELMKFQHALKKGYIDEEIQDFYRPEKLVQEQKATIHINQLVLKQKAELIELRNELNQLKQKGE